MSKASVRIVAMAMFWIALSSGLYVAARHDYLLFHVFVEVISIAIALTVFFVTFNARQVIKNNLFLLMGIALMVVAALDLLHAMSYRGMGFFQGFGSNLPTQLWIAARYVQAFSVLAGLLLLGHRRISLQDDRAYYACSAAYVLLGTALLSSIFQWRIFPTCYVEGEGLTAFKLYSEYLIIAVLGSSAVLAWRSRERFDRTVLSFLLAFLLLSMGAELAFTQYVSVYGTANMIGHYFKLYAFYALYLAIIVTGVSRPTDLLVRDLAESKDQLRKEQDMALRYLDIAGVMILVFDDAGRIVLANKKAAELLGYQKNELVGTPWVETFAMPRERQEVSHVFHELLSGDPEKVRYNENAVKTRTGEARTVWWHNEVLRDTTGTVTGFISSGEDITARKRVEEEVRHRLRMEEAVSAMSRMLLHPADEVDLDGILAFAGETTESDRAYLFRYDRDNGTMSNTHEWTAPGVSAQKDLLQALPVSAFPWWNEQLETRNYLNILNVAGIPSEPERALLAEQGICSLLVIGLRWENGPLVGFMGFDSLHERAWKKEDVRLMRLLGEMVSLYLRREHDSRALAASERRFKGLVQKSTEITIIVDAQGIITYASPSLRTVLGYEPESVQGADVYAYVKEASTSSSSVLDALPSPGESLALDADVFHASGEVRMLEVTKTNLLGDPDIHGIVFNARDVTARKRAVEERNRLLTQLTERNEELEMFTRQLYHELQSPLVTIGSYADEIVKNIDRENAKAAKLDAFVVRNAARKLSTFATDLATSIRIRKL